MKKQLTLITFALVAFSVNAQSTLKGDVNGDGEVNVTDVTMIVEHVMGQHNSNFIVANADVNSDGDWDSCHDLGNDIAGTQFDVAHVKWGGSWKMPSQDQNSELFEKCTYEWTTRNGVEGGKFTGPNGESIFLPAAGNRNNDHLSLVGLNGLYWSSTSSFSAYLARSLGFDSSSFGINYSNFRSNGFSVRPVCK